jgi:hypothetical protein
LVQAASERLPMVITPAMVARIRSMPKYVRC